jgi:hypothetical protein
VDSMRPLIAIWGDSTAGALVPGFRKLQETEQFGLAQFTVSSCQPLLAQETPVRRCQERNRRIPHLIGEAAPAVVLLHSFWGLNDTAEDFRPTIDALRSRGAARIVILGPVPVWRGGLPNIVAAHYWRTGTVLPERTDQYFERGSSDESLRKVAAELNVEYISARDVFCNADGCITRVGDSLVTSDSVHLTEAGSVFLIRAIIGRLRCAEAPQEGMDAAARRQGQCGSAGFPGADGFSRGVGQKINRSTE